MRRTALFPLALAAAIAVAYLVVAPASADLAAQQYRSWLGPGLWDDRWYAGHPTPAYSVLFPLLGAPLGPRLVGALSVVVAAACFTALATRAFRPPAVGLAAAWFAAGVALQLLTGRMTFLLGVAVGLGALLAAQRERRALALALAALTTLASPVTGAFLALAGVAWAIGGRRRLGVALAVAAIVPGLVLAWVFGEQGTEPFAASSFWPALVLTVVVAAALAAERERVLVAGAVLSALACVAAFAIPTALGGNVTRLGALAAGPLAAAVLWPRRRLALAVLVLPLAYWQLVAPVRDVAAATGDPSTRASYYAPLLAELRRRTAGPTRVEVVQTHEHWEAAFVARDVPLARGWERQLDRARAPLFYRAGLNGAGLRRWLVAEAVDWVALPDAPLDPSGRAEAALLRRGVPGLWAVWHGAHWRLYAVRGARPLAEGPARLTALGSSAFRLRATQPGTVLVRLHWSPFWAISQGRGCVERAPGDWTRVEVRAPGTVQIAQRFSAWRALTRAAGARCG